MKILSADDVKVLYENGILKNEDPLNVVLKDNFIVKGELYIGMKCRIFWNCRENYGGLICDYLYTLESMSSNYLGFESDILIRKRKLEILENYGKYNCIKN